jgi:nucleoside-diphosphate-sugar epimerase
LGDLVGEPRLPVDLAEDDGVLVTVGIRLCHVLIIPDAIAPVVRRHIRFFPMGQERADTLVTGATGFIGPHLIRELLESGRRVVGLDVRPFTAEGAFILGGDLERVPLELGSVGDAARVFDVVRAHRPREIIHMGMIIDPAYLAANRTTGLQVNVLGTVNVVEAMLAFEVERMINFSSVAVIPGPLYEPVDVQHPVLTGARGPSSGFYGASKVATEALCFAYHDALGADIRTVRPSAVYGLGMNEWVGPIRAMVEAAVRGEALHVEFGGAHARAYTHVRDVTGLVLTILEAPEQADRIFFAATGGPLTTATEVAQIVRDLVPAAEISIGDELADEEKPLAANRARLSIDNARAQLGWQPRYESMRDGVAQYLEHYRAFLTGP